MKLDIEVKLNEGMKKYIYKIWEKLENEDRTEYDVALENYRKYLLKKTVKNPEDVSVVCQLAGVCYLSRKCDGIEILETFLKRNFDILTEDEKFRMYADLAYLCEDRGCMEEKAIDYLEKAIKVNSENSDIYYKLSVIYSLNKMNQEALKNIEIACKISNEEKYNYGYALILIQNKEYKKAEKILDNLLMGDSNNIKYHFYRVLCKIYLGNKDTENIEKLLEKIKEFKMLEKTDYEKYLNWLTYEGFNTIDNSNIKDLYYLCGNYEKYCKYAENVNFNLEANYMAPYLYSLKQLNKFEKIDRILKEAEKEIFHNIEEMKTDEEYQKDTTEEELLEMIEDEKQKLKNINLVLEKILNTDFKPKLEIFMFFENECWLVDCPQHLIIDED
jgi:putative tetratricopeptide repeat-containing domain protein